MGILTDKVKGHKIIDSLQLEEVFNFIISKFEESYSKSTNILLIDILNDYYEAVEFLESKNIIIKKEFNFFIFTQLMAKIKSIGILKSSLDKNNFSQYRKYLLNEIEKSDPIVSKSISYILSDNYIINSDKDTLRDLNIFWANYLEILVNLHQYKKRKY